MRQHQKKFVGPAHTRSPKALQVHSPQSALELDIKWAWEKSRSYSEKHTPHCLHLVIKPLITFHANQTRFHDLAYSDCV